LSKEVLLSKRVPQKSNKIGRTKQSRQQQRVFDCDTIGTREIENLNKGLTMKSGSTRLERAGQVWLFGCMGIALCLVLWAAPWKSSPNQMTHEQEKSNASVSVDHSKSTNSDSQPSGFLPSNSLLPDSSKLDSTRLGSAPIESLRVGDRVMAYDPQVTQSERDSWQEPNWDQAIKLTLLMPKADGSELEIEMLRSEQWVMSQLGFLVDQTTEPNADLEDKESASNKSKEPSTDESLASNDSFIEPQSIEPTVQVPLSPLRPLFRQMAITTALIDEVGTGSGVELLGLTIQMDLPELGLTGQAIVTGIECSPEVKTGDGQVVTATFHHTSGDVIDLVVGDGASNDNKQSSSSLHTVEEKIGTTGNHPFWSVDRQDYIQASSLEIGERLLTYHGETKRVISKLARPGPAPVYNLEVFGDHTYFVGKNNILVHNSYKKAKAIPATRVAGETTSTAIGKQVHSASAAARRASGEFDLVETAIKDANGNPILVPRRVNLKTGKPQPGARLQQAKPDAVNFGRRLIVDDKPLGRPLAKDRQEIIRFIEAFRRREGQLPSRIGIQRYDPKTGQPIRTDLHTPDEFLP